MTAEQSRKVSMQAVFAAFSEAEDVTGAMLRSARKHLGFTPTGFAETLGTKPEDISAWEAEEHGLPRYLRDQVVRLAHERLNPNVAFRDVVHLVS